MSIESGVQKPMVAARQRYAAELSNGNRAHIIGVGLLTTAVRASYFASAPILCATYHDSSYDSQLGVTSQQSPFGPPALG